VKPKITTQGWQLLVLWKDKSMSWIKLKDLKASNPIECAEYAVANWIWKSQQLNGGYLTLCVSQIVLTQKRRRTTGRQCTSLDESYHTRLKKHWRLTGKWGLITGREH
jgi:hypothetical protein